MKVRNILLIFGLATLVVGPTAAQAGDEKIYPGSMCKPSTESDPSGLIYTFAGVKNVSTTEKRIVCPVVRDNIRTTIVPDSVPGGDTDARRVVALEETIVQIGHRLAELEARLYSQDKLLRDIAVLTSGHGANEPGSQRRVRHIAHNEVERSRQMRLAVVESVFVAEAIDASWSPKAIDQIREMLDRGFDPSLEMLELDCRSTLCRIEVAHMESYGHSKWQVALIGSPVARFEDLWSIEESNSDESTLSIVYAARRGHALPGG